MTLYSRECMLMDFSCQSNAFGNAPAIRPPPGLELPPLPKADLCEGHESSSAAQTEDAPAKLKAHVAGSLDDDEQLAMCIIQQAHWNSAYARMAQESLYTQQFQACLHRQGYVESRPTARLHPRGAEALAPGKSSLVNQSTEGCMNASGRADTQMRPLGAWREPLRASSGSSNASTRASSNDEFTTCFSQKLHIETPKRDRFCGGGRRVSWPVDAKKFATYDMQIVSPAFELAPFSEFKLLIKSAATGGQRGQAGFKAARGRGSIDLKCVSGASTEIPALTFRLSLIGSSGTTQRRAPVTHDFGEELMYSQPEQHPWDFCAAIDPTSHLVVVCLEVAPEVKADV